MSRHKPRQINNSFSEDVSVEGCVGLVYARVSSKKQELEGTGLQSQEGRCKIGLERESIPFEKTFPDSFSGGGDFMNRPAMRELLQYIDDRPYKKFVVIFDDLSRFARDTEFHIKLRTAFSVRGVILKCLNYNFDDSVEGKFVETVFAAKYQLDREQNKRQVVQKQKARLDNGYRAFPAPKGYTRVKDIAHGKIDVPNDDAKYVIEAIEGFASMRFVYKIDGAKFLQEKGVIASKQTPAQAIATFDKMLREIYYAGYIEYLPWGVERRVGHHQPLITLEVYDKNQIRLNKNARSFVRQDIREDFELRRLIDCADCLEKYTGAPSTGKMGKKYAYYKCKNKKCVRWGKSIATDIVHKDFEELLKQVKPCEEVVELAKVIFEDVWKDEMQNKGKIQASLVSRKNELEGELDALSVRIPKATSEIVIKQYEKQIEKVAMEIEDIEEKINTEYDYSVPNRTSLDQVMQVLKSPYEAWVSYDVSRKQRFFSFIFESNLVYSELEGYRTPNYSLPIRIFEDISTSKVVDVDLDFIFLNQIKRELEYLVWVLKGEYEEREA